LSGKHRGGNLLDDRKGLAEENEPSSGANNADLLGISPFGQHECP